MTGSPNLGPGRLRARTEDVIWREIEGDVVLLDKRSWDYVGLNAAGAVLWPLLAEGATLDELGRRLVEEFGIDEELAGADCAAFVTSLREQGLMAEGDDA